MKKNVPTPKIDPLSWIQSRCDHCIYHGTSEERALHGDDLCLRDYPRTTIKEKCKIKPSQFVRWRDAFTPRTDMYESLIINDKELLALMKKPVKDAAERRKILEGLTKAHTKTVAAKGGEARLGFGDEFDPEALSVYLADTGVPSIDSFLGGGFPLAPFTIAGKAGTGKTSTALVLAGALQAQGYVVAYVDAEHTFDAAWATTLGVNVDQLLLNQDMVMEDQLNFVLKLAESGAVDFIIYDSLNAGLPRGKLSKKSGKERDLDNADVALRARIMSDFFPRIVHNLKINQIGFCLIAQKRTTGIGSAFVREEVSGGNARKFFDSITLELMRGPNAQAPKDDDDHPLGFIFKMICKKSKVPGVREGDSMETVFWLNQGFDPVFEYVKIAMEMGIINKTSNAMCVYTDTKGVEHKFRTGKDWKVTRLVKEAKLEDDVRMQVTGEVPDEPEDAPVAA